MNFGIRVRLGLMMFLQFFAWGGWFVTLGSYLAANLHASGAQSALAYSTQSWGAIIAPIFAGLIADRFLNAERLLGIIHLVGGVLLYRIARAEEFGGFYPLLLGYMILYMPTLALVNAVAFRQMADPSRHFSGIRVWGTLGWIVAGLVISYVFAWDSTAALAAGQLRKTFYMCSIASFVLGAYSFTLPATPPPAKRDSRVSVSKLLSLDAIALLRMNLEFNPQSAKTYALLGFAYTRKVDDATAITNLQKSLELDPTNAMVRGQLEQLQEYRRRRSQQQ